MAISIEYGKYLDSRRSGSKDETARTGILSNSRWAWRYDQAQRRQSYERLAEPLSGALDRALTGLENALKDFSWPEDNLPFGFKRTVTADQALSGKLSTEARDADNAAGYYKFFSKGRDADSDSGLDPGSYSFDVSLGDDTENIDVDVAASDTWGDVLENVARAVNDSGLAVQAEVITQHNPYQKVDGLGKTGDILAFAVEPGRQSGDLEIKDKSGLMIHELDLTAADTPVLPATTGTYDLEAPIKADPTAYYSKAFDPDAQSGVSAGTRKIAYEIGGESGTFDIDVEDGMTWDELLSRTADVINSSSDKIEAQVMDTEIFSGLDDPLRMPGKTLEIKAKDPKLAERLSLSDYGGPWLDDALEFFDPSGTTPVDPQYGDRYVASATANGWTKDNIYEWDGAAWQETSPVSGNALYAEDEGADYFYDGSDWSTTPTGGFLDNLDLRMPNPGGDARMSVNGKASESAGGTFSTDRGRLVMELQDSFGERLPLKVVESMDKLAQGFTDVVDAYNDLQDFLEPNKDLFREDFVDDWREPLEDMEAELSWLGIEQVGDEGLIMADADKFWRAVGSDPARAEEVLVGAKDGLFTTWSELAGKARSPDTADSIIPKAYLQDLTAPASKVFDNEMRSDLQKLIDSELPEDSPNRTTEMEIEILKAVSGEDVFSGETGLDLPGKIFKAKG